MDTKKIVVVLLVIAVAFSVASVVLSLSAPDASDYQPVNCAEQVDCKLSSDVSSPSTGSIGLEVVEATG